jgi:uncharacterized protein (DUF952 family)
MLYHLVPQPIWRACVDEGQDYFPTTYEADGFIHLTAEPSLLLPVANHFYKDSDPRTRWVVLAIDEAKLKAEASFTWWGVASVELSPLIPSFN